MLNTIQDWAVAVLVSLVILLFFMFSGILFSIGMVLVIIAFIIAIVSDVSIGMCRVIRRWFS